MSASNAKKKKTGRRVGRRLSLAAAVLALAVIGGLFALNLYLNTARIRERAAAEASSALGTEVAIGELRVSLWKGFHARDLTVHSALPGLPDPVRIAEARLGYRLADLFRRRLAISELVLKKPVVSLVRDAEGRWNLPLMPAAEPEPEVKPERFPAAPRDRRKTVPAVLPPEREPSAWDLSVDSLRLEDLSFEYDLAPPLGRVRLEGLDIEARFIGVGDGIEIEGNLRLARGVVEAVPWVERLSLDFKLEERVFGISSLRAELLEGRLGGELTVLPRKEEAGDTIPPGAEGSLDFSDLRPARFLRGLGMDFLAAGSINAGLRFRGSLPLPEAELELTASGLKIRDFGVIEEVRLPVDLRDNILNSRGVVALLGGGGVRGDIEADLRDPARVFYRADLTVEDVDLEKLQAGLKEHSGTGLSGRVNGRAVFSGLLGETGSLEGEGGAELKEGLIADHPFQGVMAGLTGIGRLERIEFDRADVKFRAVDGILEVTEAVVRSEEIRIDGTGRVEMEPGHELDFKVRLSFHEELVRQLSPRELRLALRPSYPGDEFRGLEFRLWGTPENVRSNYLEVLARSAATGLLERELRRRIEEEE